jgi:hypothetical protein
VAKPIDACSQCGRHRADLKRKLVRGLCNACYLRDRKAGAILPPTLNEQLAAVQEQDPANRPCAACGQVRKLPCRGICNACYLQNKGDLARFPTAEVPLEQRLAGGMRGTDECWLWTGVIHPRGYGQMKIKAASHRVHQVAYEVWVGPIPEGLVIDHVCHNRDLSCPRGPKCMHRRCYNPAHLEAVPSAENSRRAKRKLTHCPKGHPYDELNTRLNRGYGVCRTCSNEKSRDWKRRARAGASSADESRQIQAR